MNYLIRINYDTEQPMVSARDLHEGLEIGTRFNDWFPRMMEYGFSEGKDFYSKMSKTNSRAGSRFKQPPKGYGILLQPLKSVFPTLNIRVSIVLTAELSEIRTPGTLTI